MNAEQHTPVIYEQPLNENIRICLRLEHLLQQANYHIKQETSWDSMAALNAILNILNIINDRSDLKNKLGQLLNQYASNLAQMEQLPEINKIKLHRLLDQLEKIIDVLHSIQGRIGQELRENEFLMAVQQRVAIPAGACCFNIPSYYLWLQQPHEVRAKNLKEWLIPFSQLQLVIDIVLKLTRSSTKSTEEIAQTGFYQSNLDPDIPYQMIRIKVPAAIETFPEISVGRHRLTIHFLELNIQNRAAQTQANIPFELALCNL